MNQIQGAANFLNMIYPEISDFIKNFDDFSPAKERIALLQPLKEYVAEKLSHKKHVRLNFICTHNSRRSHLAQIWAQTMAIHFKCKDVYCYSGGTEATALNKNIVDVLQKSGFKTDVLAKTENPIYQIKFSDNVHPIIGFSKKYDHLFNPKSKFAAVMTCSEADENCPFVPGTEKRIALNYSDPKEFDGTPLEAFKYQERSLQIAQEMFFIFSNN